MKNYNKIIEAVNRGIQLALDDFDDEQVQNVKSKQVQNRDYTKEYLDFIKDVVDLGLPSETGWFKYNLGTDYKKLNENPSDSIPEDWYGIPYAWGKIKTQMVFINGTNNIGLKLSELTPEYDVAYQNMHHYAQFYFHMPTKEQFEELLKYTENKPIKNYKNIIGLNGLELTSKINGNKLFLPASGYDGRNWQGIFGGFWSRTEEPQFKKGAYSLIFNLSTEPYSFKINSSYKYAGFYIRPVLNL